MKRLIILLIAGLLALVSLADAVEHSELSNVFMLDTRESGAFGAEHSELSNVFTLDTRIYYRVPAGGLEHSELSNLFTLDTTDAVLANILPLEPNPNPPELAVMSGGVGYLYYRAVNSAKAPVKGVAVTYTVNGKTFSSKPTQSEPSKADGLLIIPIETRGFGPAQPLNVSITHVGENALSTPLTATVQILPRSYEQIWELGASVSGKIGVSAGGGGYVKGEAEGGIAYAVDDQNALTVERQGEIGLGVGVGVKTPGGRFKIGGVKAGLGAGVSAEAIGYGTFSDAYLFDDQNAREQQMAQAALLLDTVIGKWGAKAHEKTKKVRDELVRKVPATRYEAYRTREAVGLGVEVRAGAYGYAGVELGKLGGSEVFTGANPEQKVGLILEGNIAGMMSAETEHILYYQPGVGLIGEGWAVKQEFGFDFDVQAELGAGIVPPPKPPKKAEPSTTVGIGFPKDEAMFYGRADFGKSGFVGIFGGVGIEKFRQIRQEYMTFQDGSPPILLISTGDEEKTVTFIIRGQDNIAKVQQASINLVAFLELSRQAPSGTVQVGPNAIKSELTNLMQKLATLNMEYDVTEGPVEKGFTFPVEFDAVFGVDSGGTFALDASKHLDRTTLEGVLVGGHFYPRASYLDNPQSPAELRQIVDNTLRGSWENVKDAFNQTVQKIVAGTQTVIQTVAKTVEKGAEIVKGTAKLIGTFPRNVQLTLVTWTGASEVLVAAAPAGVMAKSEMATAHTTTPVVGGYYQFSPEGEPLAEPGELTITYTDEEIAQLGINESSLRISYWDPAASRWVSVGGAVDAVNNSVTATVTALHLYALTFDATPPDVGQLTPAPDSVIADPRAVIRARIVDDTNQLDTSSIVFSLDGAEVFYIFDGESDDGVVNIFDLVTVAAHFGETANQTPPAAPQTPGSQYADLIEGWLTEARAVDDGSVLFRRGIAVLESLLNAIVPEKTALLQNYPNPFNPETWIPYQLNEASDVTITIYDALGRPIKRLDLGYQQAGLYRTRARAAHWDGRNEVGESVASGVYFVQLKTKGYQQTQRIVLLK
ncbi:T9SS type A sorting domain-containing protein [Candidatus Poribacteria bacterium]|nr:T9SS type A sorting domain-containing protein [Candidatus Poribacteria bacterium]